MDRNRTEKEVPQEKTLSFCLEWIIENYSHDKIKNNEMGMACGTYGRQESCVQNFDGETWNKAKI